MEQLSEKRPARLDPPSLRGAAARFTVREVEVAVWLGRGVEPMEIARRMGISYHTVKTHIVHARERVGARTSAQLAVMVAVQRERDRVKREAEMAVEGIAI